MIELVFSLFATFSFYIESYFIIGTAAPVVDPLG